MPSLATSARLPKYRKHRGSGQAIVTICGRDFYLGPHGTKASRINYDRLIAEWLASGRQPLVSDPDSITVTELVNRYRKHVRRHYVKNGRPTGEQPAIAYALKPLRALYGDTPAAEFGPLRLEAVRQRMVALGWARGSINRNVARVRRLFRWAVGQQLLPASVCEALRAVDGLRRGRTDARETDPVRPVDDATIDATLPHLPAVVADMVRVQRLTGMRPAELCLMRPVDIDRSGEVWRYVPESHKTEHTGRERIICIGPQAQAVLLRYLARDAQAYCFRPCDSEAKRHAAVHAARSVPMGCGNVPGSNRIHRRPKRTPGDRYDVNAYRRAIHRACDAAFPPDGVLARRERETIKARLARLSDDQRADLATWQSAHRWSPNQLRHSAATEVRRQFGLEAAQVVLGHSQANVTQVYAERDHALAARVAREVG